GFAQQGVVHGHDQRRLRRQAEEHVLADVLEEDLLIGALPRIEPVVGAPILLLMAAGANEIGHRGLLRTEQSGQHMLAEALGAGRARGRLVGDAEQRVEFLSQGARVFFSALCTSTGLGGAYLRERIRWALSATIHSTVSP